MGKVKHQKRNPHPSAGGGPVAGALSQIGTFHDSRQRPENTQLPSPSVNPFSSMSIDTGQLTPWTPEDKNCTTSSSSQVLLTRKDARRKQRHKAFLEKMNVSWRKEQEVKCRAEKQKRQGNFYLQTLDDALPTLEDLVRKTRQPKERRVTQQKARLSQSHKAQKLATLADIQNMQTLLRSQSFKEFPMVTAMENLRTRLQEGL